MPFTVPTLTKLFELMKTETEIDEKLHTGEGKPT